MGLSCHADQSLTSFVFVAAWSALGSKCNENYGVLCVEMFDWKLLERKAHNLLPEFAQKKFQHDFVRTKSGTRFHYVHTVSEDSPLMLCLHGFPECCFDQLNCSGLRYSWRGVLEKFSSKYHVVAYDMRGYGDSDKPKCRKIRQIERAQALQSFDTYNIDNAPLDTMV
ncbi:unnamed protein product [Clavelina lepadiformis]|uniref:AB hydrolase-1 domain-containing protein n=1 Tax=Clavelina lepadiformis TaxID=159417 RepID=A0ABP0FNQ9_CLALP